MTEPLHILIADDQRDILEALRLLLKSESITCQTVSDPAAAIAAAKKTGFNAALIDLNYSRDTTSGMEGLELLKALKQVDCELPVVVMTAWGTINLAVEAIRQGAGDFIEKPWDNARLMSVLRNQVALGGARASERRLRAENKLLGGADDELFIAQSPAMQHLLAQIERVAPTDANLLILGENGVGKGVVARIIHRASRRATQSLVKVNMGGIAESVFESEMFGHVRGAFTDAKSDRIGRFELADGGTLFLDEIANVPISQQPKLLRVLEEGEFERVGSSRTLKTSARLLTATNADIDAEVVAGRFRKDLLFRINTVQLRVPPLRERGADIEPMARAFLARSNRAYRRETSLSAPALRALQQYQWPGNVRELAHTIERAVLMCAGDLIDATDLALPVTDMASVSPGSPGASDGTLEQTELAMIRAALERCDNNILKTAEALGLSRAALYRRMEKFGLRASE